MALVAPFLVCVALCLSPTVPLTGTIVGPNGQPVAGAEIFLGGVPIQDQKVVARGRSDEQGRFAIDRPAGLKAINNFSAPVLWVVKPGFRLGSLRFAGPMPKADEPVRVVLGPPGNGEVHVEGPDGRPVAGARARLVRIDREQASVPEAVEDRIEAATGPDGRAVIEAAANNEIEYIAVHARGLGIQGRLFRPLSSGPKRVRLRPVASLDGRLQLENGASAPLQGWRVRAYARTVNRGLNPSTIGLAEGTTDAEGRFAFPALAPGRLQLTIKPPTENLPVAADVSTSLRVTMGQANSVVVRLRKLVTITGLVRERQTGRPVPGALMNIAPARGGTVRTATTDAEGRYTFSTLPGKWSVHAGKMPPSFVSAPNQPWTTIDVSKGQGRAEVAPWEAVPAAPPLRFIVRDEQGRPAARARVVHVSGSGWSDYVPETADDHGEFAIPGLAPNGRISVMVRLGDRTTDGPVNAVAGTTKPIAVTIFPGLTTALAGRVLGPDGAPIADAELRFEFLDKTPQKPNVISPPPFPQSFGVGDGNAPRTGPDGTFLTPKDVYRKHREFRVEAVAEGFLLGKSDWASADNGRVERTTFPDLVLRPRPTERVVRGTVVDRAGKALADIRVFQWSSLSPRTEAITDDAGRFRLDGVPSGPALVFAEKDGHRFGGAVAAPGDAPVEIRLARTDGPPIAVPKPLPPPLTRAEQRRIARELLSIIVFPAREGSMGPLGKNVVPALARVDPDRVFEMLENRTVEDPARVLVQVALGQFEDDPKAAIETIEADRAPDHRAQGFLALADAATAAREPLRLDLIDRAYQEARRVKNKDVKLNLLHQIADRWLELGLVDRARPVLLEGRTIIAALPRDEYSYAAERFGEALAAIDSRTANTLFKGQGRKNANPNDAGTIQHHQVEAALRLAAIDPAEAERLVPEDLSKTADVDRIERVLRVCQRMARADLPRARRILDRLDAANEMRMGGHDGTMSRLVLVPEGLALMAEGRAEVDPAGARALLDGAFERLHKLASDRRRGNGLDVAKHMAMLLPIVERVDPNRLEERLWLTAACRSPVFENASIYQLREPVVLAAIVARYDRAMAAAIIAPALDRMRGALADMHGFGFQLPTAIKALAVYDPRAVVAIVRGLPPSAKTVPEPRNGWQGASLDAQVRLAAAEVLGLPVDEQYRKILGAHLGPPSFQPPR